MFSVFEAAAQIQIVINTPQVYLGGAVTGIVVLKVIKESIDGNSVVLTFNCREDTRADYTSSSTDSEGRSETTHHSTSQSAPIVATSLALASSSTGSFARGQYEFPFTFQLRTDLPPTMSASDPGSEGGACSINYSLHARLDRTTGFFKHKIEDIKPFIVLPVLTPSDAPRTPVSVGPLSVRAVFCCCFDRGKFDLGLSSPSNWYTPNEQIQVNYVVQNDSHARVDRLFIGFYEKITWSANGYSRSALNPIQTQVNVDVSAFVPLRKHREKQVLSMEELHRVLVSGTNTCNMIIPGSAFASYRGQLIVATHSLVLTVVTPGGTSKPSIECPISIAWKTYNGAFNPNNTVQGTVMNNNAVIPVVEAYVVPVDGGIQMNSGYQKVPITDNVVVSYESTPTAPPSEQLSYQTWIATFKSSFNQVQDVRSCPQDIIQSLNASQFSELFSSIRSSLDSVAIAEIITERRSAITCELILAAVSVSSSLVKSEMVRKFAVKCVDKQNYSLLRSGLSELEYMECGELFRVE